MPLQMICKENGMLNTEVLTLLLKQKLLYSHHNYCIFRAYIFLNTTDSRKFTIVTLFLHTAPLSQLTIATTGWHTSG
jgi:hypothetical protein